jgi:hypothetical protein
VLPNYSERNRESSPTVETGGKGSVTEGALFAQRTVPPIRERTQRCSKDLAVRRRRRRAFNQRS